MEMRASFSGLIRLRPAYGGQAEPGYTRPLLRAAVNRDARNAGKACDWATIRS